MGLKELEPFIRNGKHLQTGRPFKQLAGMRSREALANWLICAVADASYGTADRWSFTSDPVDGDGVLLDQETGETFPTEHVMVANPRGEDISDLGGQIIAAIEAKQAKGGAAYAAGKTLVVFADVGGGLKWFPNRVARQLPTQDFAAIWAVGLQRIEDGSYVYGVTFLDVSAGNAPVWLVKIAPDFSAWQVEPVQ